MGQYDTGGGQLKNHPVQTPQKKRTKNNRKRFQEQKINNQKEQWPPLTRFVCDRGRSSVKPPSSPWMIVQWIVSYIYILYSYYIFFSLDCQVEVSTIFLVSFVTIERFFVISIWLFTLSEKI